MFNNPELEKEYIFKQLEHSENQKRISNLKLNVGGFVRYIMPQADGLKKRRYNTSKESYRIENVNGNMYTLIAKDGTVMNLSRFKLIPVLPGSVKWAATIPGKWNGFIKKIISHDPKTKKYRVLFSVPDQPDYEDVVPESYINQSNPIRALPAI